MTILLDIRGTSQFRFVPLAYPCYQHECSGKGKHLAAYDCDAEAEPNRQNDEFQEDQDNKGYCLPYWWYNLRCLRRVIFYEVLQLQEIPKRAGDEINQGGDNGDTSDYRGTETVE